MHSHSVLIERNGSMKMLCLLKNKDEFPIVVENYVGSKEDLKFIDPNTICLVATGTALTIFKMIEYMDYKDTSDEYGIPSYDKFVIDDNNPRHNLIIGKRDSGREEYIDMMLQKLAEDDEPIVIISPADRKFPYFSVRYPQARIYHEHNDKIWQDILDRQNNDKQKVLNLVMHDCFFGNGKWMKNGNLMEILFNARYYNVRSFLAFQYPPGLPPHLRVNFDYVFFLYDDLISNKRRLYDRYGGFLANFNIFNKTYDKLTKDGGVMVIKQRGEREIFSDKVNKSDMCDKGMSKIELGT